MSLQGKKEILLLDCTAISAVKDCVPVHAGDGVRDAQNEAHTAQGQSGGLHCAGPVAVLPGDAHRHLAPLPGFRATPASLESVTII